MLCTINQSLFEVLMYVSILKRHLYCFQIFLVASFMRPSVCVDASGSSKSQTLEYSTKNTNFARDCENNLPESSQASYTWYKSIHCPRHGLRIFLGNDTKSQTDPSKNSSFHKLPNSLEPTSSTTNMDSQIDLKQYEFPPWTVQFLDQLRPHCI